MIKRGFTLIELLVVMAILGVLMVVVLANFQTSQIKARDAQRKSDLRQIANALEAYMNDHGSYPAANNGRIVGCECTNKPCGWGEDPREFCDANNTIYMKEIPDDVTGNPHYCYLSDGDSFRLYAKLENNKDPECLKHDAKGNCLLLDIQGCGGGGIGVINYNFGISSSNTKPYEE